MGEGRREGLLSRDAGAAGQRVEGDALAEEEVARGPADRGAVGDGVEGGAFFDVPLHSGGQSMDRPAAGRWVLRAVQLPEHFVDKWNAG